MFKVSQRIRSKNMSDKWTAITFYVFMALSAYIVFLTAMNYERVLSDHKIYMPLALVYLFIVTTVSGFLDFANINKLHNGTLAHYIAEINPSRFSLLGRAADESSNGEKYKDKEGEIHPLFATTIIIGVCWLVIGLIVSIASFTLFPVCLAIINILLIIFSMFTGEKVNSTELTIFQLKKIDDIQDISDNERNFMKKMISELINEKASVTRIEMLRIVKKVAKMQAIRMEKENIEMKKKDLASFIISE